MSIMETERRLRALTAGLPKALPRKPPDSPAAEVTALYNGACPVCRFEMRRYQKIGGGTPDKVDFQDATEDVTLLVRHGLSLEGVMRRLHVVTRAGKVVVGMDAFILLWRQMPRYRWLARAVGLPGFHWAARQVYDRVLVPALWHINRRRRQALLKPERRRRPDPAH